MHSFELSPPDSFNEQLVRHVHPPGWQNPTPRDVYNLVVIGGGTAGIISALGTAGLGGSVALVERHLLGGDCLNFGCVPSKALLRAARAAYDVAHSPQFGVPGRLDGPIIFSEVMQRMRRLRAEISAHDSAARFQSLGVDVHLGDARFTGPQAMEVGGQTLRFRRCVIATGGRAATPEVPGLKAAGFLTNETVFSLTELPRRLAIIGGGPIGCELAQAFRRFGSEVHLIQRGARLLAKDDPAASQVVAEQFRSEDIATWLNAIVRRVESVADGKQLTLETAGDCTTLIVDEILVAAGRAPNVEGLGLEAAGVKHGSRGIEVNDFLQTTNGRIYAAGDIVGKQQFTHAADAMARLCIQNAFFFGRKRLSKLVMPWTTYTDPEVAHVGLTAEAARERGIEVTSYREDLRSVDRAVLDGEQEGFAMVHCRRGTGQVVGATLVARHAGEMIGEITLLMNRSLSLGALASVIHCYPTQVEVLKRIADQYNKTRLTPRVAWLLKAVLRWR